MIYIKYQYKTCIFFERLYKSNPARVFRFWNEMSLLCAEITIQAYRHLLLLRNSDIRASLSFDSLYFADGKVYNVLK
jgi:hypothetical protein